MSDTPAWAVERAREILALIDVEPSEWCPDCDGQGEIDDGKCGRCGKYGCRTKTCPACNGGKMKPIDRVGIISSALTVPEGHVRLPSGEDVRLEPFGDDIGGNPIPLPRFADGTLWLINEWVWAIVDGDIHKFLPMREPSWTSSGWVLEWDDGEIELSKCYPNEAAAESARAGGVA